jgi:general secretion pathway protein A
MICCRWVVVSPARLNMDHASIEELVACLKHLLVRAGNATLMSEPLIRTLCEHALGNYRVLTGMASELLMTAMQQELTTLDEKLYFGCFEPQQKINKVNKRKR